MFYRRALIFTSGGDSSVNLVQLTKTSYRQEGVHPIDCGPAQGAEQLAQLDYTEHDIVHIISDRPKDVIAFSGIRSPLIWDVSQSSSDRCETFNATREDLLNAAAAAATIIGASPALVHHLESKCHIALGQSTFESAIKFLKHPIAIAVGSGFGNIINATPLISALANRFNTAVDVVIHGFHSDATQLFTGSPYVNIAYPSAQFAEAVDYAEFIVTACAAPYRPYIKARQYTDLNAIANFNVEGRFIPEWQFYMLGLEKLYGSDWPAHAHGSFPHENGAALFVRNQDPLSRSINRDGRIIGISNGTRDGIWRKRSWPHIEELSAKLVKQGYEVRSFGVGEEYVEGCKDYTGLELWQTINAINECDFYIGHDSGLGHIADALGIPGLHIFGPTGAVKNGPISAVSRTVTRREACSPCHFKPDFYRCTEPTCMTMLSSDDVLAEFDQLKKDLTLDSDALSDRKRTDLADLLDFELTSHNGPGKEEFREQFDYERFSFYADDENHFLEIAAKFFELAAIDRFHLAVDEMYKRWPESASVKLMSAWSSFLFDASAMDRDDYHRILKSYLHDAKEKTSIGLNCFIQLVTWLGFDDLAAAFLDHRFSGLDIDFLNAQAALRQCFSFDERPNIPSIDRVDAQSNDSIKLQILRNKPEQIVDWMRYFFKPTPSLNDHFSARPIINDPFTQMGVALDAPLQSGDCVAIFAIENPEGAKEADIASGLGAVCKKLAQIGLRLIVICEAGAQPAGWVRYRDDILFVQLTPSLVRSCAPHVLEAFSPKLSLCATQFNAEERQILAQYAPVVKLSDIDFERRVLFPAPNALTTRLTAEVPRAEFIRSQSDVSTEYITKDVSLNNVMLMSCVGEELTQDHNDHYQNVVLALYARRSSLNMLRNLAQQLQHIRFVCPSEELESGIERNLIAIPPSAIKSYMRNKSIPLGVCLDDATTLSSLLVWRALQSGATFLTPQDADINAQMRDPMKIKQYHPNELADAVSREYGKLYPSLVALA